MLRAVIFDMDGVIIDSEPQHARAAVNTLAELGVTIDMAYCYQFIGTTTNYMMETLIDDFNLSISPEELIALSLKHKKKLVMEEGYAPIPFVEELIARLYKDGIRLAIASSSSPQEISDVTKALGIHKYFDKFISGLQVENPKPAPDIFQKALKELGTNARETVIIEDSLNGILAADAAGIPSIGFINPNSGDQDLQKANVLTDSFEKITTEYIDNVCKRAAGEAITITTTRRLIIRELSVKDITEMYRIQTNPKVSAFIDALDEMLETEIEKHKAYIKYVYAFYGFGQWGVFSKTTGGLIGKCGIEHEEVDGKPELTLSYLVDEQHWGYGYAHECCQAVLTYAREKLDIHRVVSVIDIRNLHSIRIAKSLGMQEEKQINHKGRECYVYSIAL